MGLRCKACQLVERYRTLILSDGHPKKKIQPSFVCSLGRLLVASFTALRPFLSTPMGVDYVVIGFDMEVQPLVTHNAA